VLPQNLQQKLDARKAANALRTLSPESELIDFASNDYLGFGGGNYASAKAISEKTNSLIKIDAKYKNGASGSRLLTGNHFLYGQCEKIVARFHESETALIFNSGYDANIGFFQSVPQRGDLILFDEYIHASIRDGIGMSNAQSYKWTHNDLDHLEWLLEKHSKIDHAVYVVTESVFSMDGDTPDLKTLIAICKKYSARCVIDEAHATGVIGTDGQGVVQYLGIQSDFFARIVTFGKGIGAHGGAILGAADLREYLINFSRSFIYTTGLPPHSVATVMSSYTLINELTTTKNSNSPIHQLHQNISYFKEQLQILGLTSIFIDSDSAIHCAIIPGNNRVKKLARLIEEAGFNVKPILSPTVARGQERLRFCLHAYNSLEEIKTVLSLMSRYLNNEILS